MNGVNGVNGVNGRPYLGVVVRVEILKGVFVQYLKPISIRSFKYLKPYCLSSSWVFTSSTRTHPASAADNEVDPGLSDVMCASDAPHGWEDITPPVTLAHSPEIKVAVRFIRSFTRSLARSLEL